MPSTWSPAQNHQGALPSRALLTHIFGEALSVNSAFERIETGISTEALDVFVNTFHTSYDELATVLKMSERTLARRRAQGQLNSVESDRFYRLLALYARATDVLDGIEAADEWMRSPAVALGDRTPLDYSTNEAGTRRVEQLLTRIEYGVFS